MSKVWVIFVKEVRSYFLSPIAYVVMTGFMVLSGLMFYQQAVSFPQIMDAARQSGALDIIKQNRINYFLISPLLNEVGLILIFLIPVLTMRLFSEEKRSHTDELLLTSPLTVNQIVLSKYLAGLFFALLLVAITACYVGVVFFYAAPDPGATFTAFLSLALFVACGVAIGAFTSSLTENQIVASVSCLIVELLFASFGVASQSVDSDFVAKILGYLSLQTHMKSFMDGLIVAEDIVYFASFAFLFLFLTNRSIESSRWR